MSGGTTYTSSRNLRAVRHRSGPGARRSAIALVGEGVEKPRDAQLLFEAARMHGVACAVRPAKGRAWSQALAKAVGGVSAAVKPDEILSQHTRILACVRLPGAAPLYGFRPGRKFALVVGQAAHKLSRLVRPPATQALYVPTDPHGTLPLSMAATAAVALHYLCGPEVEPIASRANTSELRPELLLMGGRDPFELGGAIRSAVAFGWRRIFVEDTERVWFGRGHARRSKGRQAVRRSGHEVRLIPCAPDASYNFPEVTIVTTARRGRPLHRTRLADGPRQLVVIPDETSVSVTAEPWARLGAEVRFACLDLPKTDVRYRYALVAAVALAEISRQVGLPVPGAKAPELPLTIQNRLLERLAQATGELISPSDLAPY